jgi:hypothetical protein
VSAVLRPPPVARAAEREGPPSERALIDGDDGLQPCGIEHPERSRKAASGIDASRRQSCLNLAAARLRYIVGTAWSTKCYMNMRPLYQPQLMQTEAVASANPIVLRLSRFTR